MKALLLSGPNQLAWRDIDPPPAVAGFRCMRVLAAGICHSDYTMWARGHRDLILPRVLGHEMLLADPESGGLYTVWPGVACGQCRYCRDGRENLCERMRILGFHVDGAFAEYAAVPEAGLFLLAPGFDPVLACFAEPLACACAAMEALALAAGERLLIIGGGVLGLLLSLACLDRGGQPVVIECNAKKRDRITTFCREMRIGVTKEITETDFPAAVSACDNPEALATAMEKLGKGGRLCFFSGLSPGLFSTQILNLIHYREITMRGCYGPCRRHMALSLALIGRWQQALPRLIEQHIPPWRAEEAFTAIADGQALKYIIHFTEDYMDTKERHPMTENHSTPLMNRLPDGIAGHAITAISPDWLARAHNKIDNKTKPLGALGRIEEMAVQLSAIQESDMPRADRKLLLCFAADHGVVAEGVSAYPSAVTEQMSLNFLSGGAAINVFCRHYGINHYLVDVGVKAELPSHPMLIKAKIRPGTGNMALEPAMTKEEALAAMQAGANAFLGFYERDGCDIFGLGELGIGNTTAAAAIISAVTGLPPAQVTGRGTGVDDEGLARKTEVIARALILHRPDPQDGLAILSAVGGLEIAAMCGAMLAAAEKRCAIVLDGVIATAAALVAWLFCPVVADYFIAGHRSVEIGHMAALKQMGLEPLLELNMRLGEGTGAAIAISLAELSARVQREMASFEDAGVSGRLD